MAITERNRHQLYQRLEEVLGREEAAVLMEHLPPVGWADVATKRDLDHLADKLVGHWRLELNRALIAIFTANIALAGVVLAAAKLA